MFDVFEKKSSYPEIKIQQYWNSVKKGTKFLSTDNKEVIIQYQGLWNFEKGPDFLGAEFYLCGIKIIGDIEIHNNLSDWISHGHSNDKTYSNVKLHVILKNDVKTQNANFFLLPDIPVVLLNKDNIESNSKNKGYSKSIKGNCCDYYKLLPLEEIVSVFSNAGRLRFEKKVYAFVEAILKNSKEKAFLQNIIKACGYKKNSEQFGRIFERVAEHDFDGSNIYKIIALFFGESGLLPDTSSLELSPQMKEYVSHLWEFWWQHRKESADCTKPVFHSVRPYNNPCRRLVAASILYKRFTNEIKDFLIPNLISSDKCSDFLNMVYPHLLCSDEMWSQHIDFFRKSEKKVLLLGKARALDIVVNVILPFAGACGKLEGNVLVYERSLDFWMNLPALQPNIYQKIGQNRWFSDLEMVKHLFSKSANQQGAQFICQNMCEYLRMNCEKCIIYNMLIARLPLK